MRKDSQSPMDVPTMPSGTEVASYATYLEASRAVDLLGDSGSDVSTITIVGTDLHMVERVTGRLTAGKVALSGAGTGAMWGLMMGLMMSFAAQEAGGTIWILSGMVGGAVVGIIMLELWYLFVGNKRDFTSRSQVVASRYAVLASSDINETYRLLQGTAGNQIRPPRVEKRDSSGPSEYGSRPDEQPRFGVRVDPDVQQEDASNQNGQGGQDDRTPATPQPAFGAYAPSRRRHSASDHGTFSPVSQGNDPVNAPVDPPSDPHNPWSLPSSLASSLRTRRPRQDQKDQEDPTDQHEPNDHTGATGNTGSTESVEKNDKPHTWK